MPERTPGDALAELGVQGIRLFVRDGFLRYRGPAGAYTDELRALVASHRGVFLRDWRCMACERIVDALFGFPPLVVCRECAPRREQ